MSDEAVRMRTPSNVYCRVVVEGESSLEGDCSSYEMNVVEVVSNNVRRFRKERKGEESGDRPGCNPTLYQGSMMYCLDTK